MKSDIQADVILRVQDYTSTNSVIDIVQYAEELGYKRVSMGETTGWNQVGILSILANETDEIGLSNDVFSPYSRSPALLGQTAATIQELSNGRYSIGLGTSSPALVEDWHGQSFNRPLRNLRESIEIIRLLLKGERLNYDGEIYQLNGLKFTGDEYPSTPINIACLGPKATELTGRFADGWTPQLFTPDGLRERLKDLKRGAELGSRDVQDIRVSPTIRCCVNEDRNFARNIARQSVAFSIGAYGPYYRKSISEQGWEDVAEELQESWEENKSVDEIAKLVPDKLLDQVTATGTPREVKDKLLEFNSIDGVDVVRIGFFAKQPRDNKYKTLRSIMSDNE